MTLPTPWVRATQDEHAVLLVGHNHTSLLINDPLPGQAAVAVDADRFQAAWQQLGAQALTVAAPAPAARYQRAQRARPVA